MQIVDPGQTAEYFAGRTLYWGDIHGHTAYSDGWGTPEQFYDHAIHTRGLDFSAVTDHAEWLATFKENLSFVDGAPLDLWQRTLSTADTYYQAGEFVTLAAFEWTSNEYGHRCIYFRDTQDVPGDPLSSYTVKTPEALWQTLQPYDAMTISHHICRLNTATKWEHYDPAIERLVEIYSKWGNAESAWTFYEPYFHMTAYPWTRLLAVKHAVQYTLQQPEYRIGVVAGSDSHQGRPGSTQRSEDLARGPILSADYYDAMNAERFLQVVRAGYTHADRGKEGPAGGGLAGIWAPALTRGDIWDAMYARHTVGSTGVKPQVQLVVVDSTAPETSGVLGEEMEVDGYPTILADVACEVGSIVASAELLRNGAKIAEAFPALQTCGLRYTDAGLSKGSTAGYLLRLALTQDTAHNDDGDQTQLYDENSREFYLSGDPQDRELVWTSPVWVTRRRPW